jgi:hypothetical protein
VSSSRPSVPWKLEMHGEIGSKLLRHGRLGGVSVDEPCPTGGDERVALPPVRPLKERRRLGGETSKQRRLVARLRLCQDFTDSLRQPKIAATVLSEVPSPGEREHQSAAEQDGLVLFIVSANERAIGSGVGETAIRDLDDFVLGQGGESASCGQATRVD